MRMAFTVLASSLLALGAAYTQRYQGTITGTVADSDGALMPGVRIEAKNAGSGALYQVASSSTGTYTFSQLPPGTYEISASVPGFRRYIRTGIKILESQVMRIDIGLVMLSSDEILTNDSVLQLLKARIDEDLIISKVRNSQRNFDLSVQGMVRLKEGGASDRLMHFLMDPTKPAEPRTRTEPVSPTAAPVAAAIPEEPSKSSETSAAKIDSSLPKEIGIYIRSENRWVEIQPEVVVWQSGGMLKRFATAGIIQGDINGRIKGAHSSSILRTPLEFIVVTPEGVTIAEYQLIHLRKSGNDREFRTVTGGIFSTTGGATRDSIQFEGTKVINRTYTVKLPAMDAGDYGFLPTSSASPGASSNVGKMYTFQVK